MFIDFPYTDAHQLNLDWILNEIKHQVKSVNNTFPDHAGNINLPGVAGVSSVDMIGADGAGNVEPIINANRIFKNKKILVIGDSISNTTHNWTEFLSDMVQPYGATVTNHAVDGDSFAGQMNNGYTQVSGGFDIVILFLGVNDWQGQWNWESGAQNSLIDATTGMITEIQTANPTARYVFMSPIPNMVNDAEKTLPRNVYTGYYQKKFHKAGFQVIDGSSIPDFKPGSTDILYDGLHPTALGSEKIAHYIINSMITEESSFAPVTATGRIVEIRDGDNVIGYVSIQLLSSGLCSFKLTANAMDVAANTELCQLPDIYSTAVLYQELAVNISRIPDYISLDNSTHKLVYHTDTAGNTVISTPSTTFLLDAFKDI